MLPPIFTELTRTSRKRSGARGSHERMGEYGGKGGIKCDTLGPGVPVDFNESLSVSQCSRQWLQMALQPSIGTPPLSSSSLPHGLQGNSRRTRPWQTVRSLQLFSANQVRLCVCLRFSPLSSTSLPFSLFPQLSSISLSICLRLNPPPQKKKKKEF